MSRPVVVVTRTKAAAALMSQLASRKQTMAASDVAEAPMMCAAVLGNAKGQADGDEPLEHCGNQERKPHPENGHRQVVDDLVLGRVEFVLRPIIGTRGGGTIASGGGRRGGRGGK